MVNAEVSNIGMGGLLGEDKNGAHLEVLEVVDNFQLRKYR